MQLFTLVATTLLTLAAAAAQPMQCLNPDTVNGLVFLGRSDMKMAVTRALPAFMSSFHAPAGFSLIGTGAISGATTKVAYKASLSSDKAYAALLAALGTEGWTVESTPASTSTFNMPGGVKEGVLCRNGERRAVTATEVAGASYINILVYPQERPRECNAPQPGLGFDMSRNAAPRLQFPAGTSLAQGSSGGGGGGNNSIYTTSSRIITTETPTRLVDYLASQVTGQGWQPDSGWADSASAGSTWRKNNGGELSWGTLEIVRVSEGTYDVNFTLVLPQ